ncbi:MAG: MBL fold metallo-hydrolase [Thermodesulfobacteriota bacterium]
MDHIREKLFGSRRLAWLFLCGLTICAALLWTPGGIAPASAGRNFKSYIITTSAGDLKITFIGHGTLMFEFGGRVIHVDPWTKQADYDALPQADLILLTHHHQDHLDPAAIGKIRTDKTVVVMSEKCAEQVQGGRVVKNGDTIEAIGLTIEVVPAYNLVHLRPDGQPWHPKGEGNGYILTFGDKRVYVAGDTENTPEMKALTGIDVAFLPMNIPYTMTPEMVADAARAFKPKILYPYHTGDTDVSVLPGLLKDTPEVEVRLDHLAR